MYELFDFIYKTFSRMTLFTQMPVIILRVFPVGTGRNNRHGSALLKILPELIAVISFVRRNCGGPEIIRQRSVCVIS